MSVFGETRGREKFKQLKSLIILFTKVINILPKKIRKYLFRLFRNVDGIVGIGIRYILLKTLAKNVGDNVSIHSNVYLLSPENISIGNNVSIHPMSYIDATGEIDIGSDVSIAHNVTILSTSHSFNLDEIPIKDQKILYKKTKINTNVWVGAKSTILYGKEIDSGSIIGADSLVTKDVKSNQIVGGIPAKVIRQRI